MSNENRVIHVYDIPAPMANGVQKVGLVELTAQEELQATKRSHGDSMRLAYELAKQSLVEVNDQKVSLADGSADEMWNKMSPKVRNLVLTAYADLHAPPEGAIEGFLKSHQQRV